LILDKTPLEIISIQPQNGSTNIDTTVSPTIIFNDNIREDMLNNNYFKIKKGSYNVPSTIYYFSEQEKNKIVIDPIQNLNSSTIYTIEISEDVKEEKGRTLGTNVYSSFTTKDAEPPKVISIDPASDPDCKHPLDPGENLNTLVSFLLIFSEPIDPNSVNGDNIVLKLNSEQIPLYFGLENENKKVRATADNKAFNYNERYEVIVQNIKDLNGNVMVSTGNYYFCTKDTSGPIVSIILDSKIKNNEVVEGQQYKLTASVEGSDIEKVEWYVNNQLVLSDTSLPYDYTFTAPLLSSGVTNLDIIVKAIDYSSNIGTAKVNLKVVQDLPPVISEFSVSPNQNVYPGDTISSTVKSYDDISLKKITLMVYGNYQTTITKNKSGCTDPTNPCSETFQITLPITTQPGQVKFKAEVEDTFGNKTTSEEIIVSVNQDTTPPVIESTYPPNDTEITEGTQFIAKCKVSSKDVQRVEFTFNNQTFIDTTPENSEYSQEFTAPEVSQATNYALVISAYDYAGNKTEININLIIKPVFDQDAPTIVFTCPSDGALLPENYLIPLTVSATDNSSISKIEFYYFDGSNWQIFATYEGLSSNPNSPIEKTAMYTTPNLSELEDYSTMKFKAIAYDYNNPPKTGEAILNIQIKDTNSNTIIINADTTINENDNSYNGKTIIIDGKTLKIKKTKGSSWVLSFQNLIILNGGNLTQEDTTTSQEYELKFNVANKIYIECGYTDSSDPTKTSSPSKIDVSGKGYNKGRTYPNSTSGASDRACGGSYGGYGGAENLSNFISVPYGSFKNPIDSGGGAGKDVQGERDGGGIISIESIYIINDGKIMSNGNDFGSDQWYGTGSGGSIKIISDYIKGKGLISANGGTNLNSGSGGRIAVYFKSMDIDFINSIYSKGGQSADIDDFSIGAPGTIYLENLLTNEKSLIVDNLDASTKGKAQYQKTKIPSIGSGNVISKNGNIITCSKSFPYSIVGLNIRFLKNGNILGDYEVVAQSNNTLTLDKEPPDEVVNSDFLGVIKINSLKIRNAVLETEDLLEVIGNVYLENNSKILATVKIYGDAYLSGSVGLYNDFYVYGNLYNQGNLKIYNNSYLYVQNDLRILSGYITHQDTDLLNEYYLTLKVDGTLYIEEGASIDVSGKGYESGRTYKNFPFIYIGNQHWYRDVGGSYGGIGGKPYINDPEMMTYGSFLYPFELGSGTGTARADYQDGGGSIYIEANEIILKGKIISDAENLSNQGYGASGGSIYIDTNKIKVEKNGLITANGGAGNSCSGGGGRIAIYYNEDLLENLSNKIKCRGGTVASYYYGTVGGAGTIYLKKKSIPYGDLIVDNTPHDSNSKAMPTTLPSVGKGIIIGVDGNVIKCKGEKAGWGKFPFSIIGYYIRIYDGDNYNDYLIIDQEEDNLTLNSSPGNVVGKRYQGIIKLNSINVIGNSLLITDDIIETTVPFDLLSNGKIIAPIKIDGNYTISNKNILLKDVEISGDLNIINNSTITVPNPNKYEFYPLKLKVGGNIYIDSSSKIDVSGKGYVAQYTYPQRRDFYNDYGNYSSSAGLGGYEYQNSLVLTKVFGGIGSANARMWLEKRTKENFEVEFDVKIDNEPYDNNGFVFMFYKDNRYDPSYGYYMGFFGYGSCNGYGIEFDFIKNNFDTCDVPHIALIQNQSDTHLACSSINFSYENWHKVKIIVDKDENNNDVVYCYLDNALVLQWTGTLDRTNENMGFCGSSNDAIIIDNLNIKIKEDPILVLQDDFSKPSNIWIRPENQNFRFGELIYGSFKNPKEAGSGSRKYNEGRAGGGVIEIEANKIINNGKILANVALYSSASGGSINIKTKEGIEGNGEISAMGIESKSSCGSNDIGSGGRISITGSVDQNLSINAIGGCTNGNYKNSDGAAGTIYIDDGFKKQLIVSNTNSNNSYLNSNITPFPSIGSGAIEYVSSDQNNPIQYFKVLSDLEEINISKFSNAIATTYSGDAFDPKLGLPNNVLDNKSSTNWRFSSPPQYIIIDIGRVYPIEKISILNSSYFPIKNYKIYSSKRNDFSDEIFIAQGTLPDTNEPQFVDHNFSPPIYAQYIKIYVDEIYHSRGEIADVNIYIKQNKYALAHPYIFEGGYIYFTKENNPENKQGPYEILYSDEFDSSIIFVKVNSNQLDLLTLFNNGYTNFSGLYKFDEIQVKGGAYLQFLDPIDCSNITVDQNSKLCSPNIQIPEGGCQ